MKCHSSNLRLVIADDHPIFREGLRKVLDEGGAGRVLAEASDGSGALAMVREHRPDMVLLDIAMPGLNGLGVAREIRNAGLPTAIVFLTMFKEEDLFNEALDLGALGYVLKENAVNDILQCVRDVAEGKTFISPAIAPLLVRRLQRPSRAGHGHPLANLLQHLTPAERRILRSIAQGMASKEIAAEFFISPKTVENHRLNIAGKLDVHGNNALLRFAIEHRHLL